MFIHESNVYKTYENFMRKSFDNVPAIYLLVNKVNQKIYVGKTRRLKNRLKEHYQPDYQRYNGTKLTNAKNKYGVDSFVFAVLEFCDESELSEREEHYMKLLNPFDDNGYNIRRQSDDCPSFVMPIEQREKISNSLKKYFEDNENPFKGKKHSAESRERIKKNLRNPDGTLKANYTSEEYREKRRKFAKDNNIISRLNDWITENGSPCSKKVQMICKETGEVLKEFDSIKEASSSFGKERGTAITNCLSGRSKSAYGYFWKYSD